MKCFLFYAGSPHEKPIPFRSMAEAKDESLRTARELARFDQNCEASLHLRDERIHDEPKMCEYPSAVLSLTARGNLKVEAA